MTTVANNVLALFFSNVSMGVEQYEFFSHYICLSIISSSEVPGTRKNIEIWHIASLAIIFSR